MIAVTEPSVLSGVESLVSVRPAIEELLEVGEHSFGMQKDWHVGSKSEAVRQQLDDLGYI
jgi:hypothetical protein